MPKGIIEAWSCIQGVLVPGMLQLMCQCDAKQGCVHVVGDGVNVPDAVTEELCSKEPTL